MEIGINEQGIDDDLDDFTPQDVGEQSKDGNEPDKSEPSDDTGQENKEEGKDEDVISSLLKSRGIEDKSKIKFENEEGSVEEVDWNNLSNADRLNILNSSSDDPETNLDDSEIQLINAIRDSGMSPSEYLQYIEDNGVNRYIQNNQENSHQYSVDQYSDDELFLADFISRMGDVTEEEAQEALEKAKSNEALFNKQIGAIRNEYKTVEDENIRQAQVEQEQAAQEQYNQFANQVANEIGNLTEFAGCDLNLEDEDMQDLYDFITGTDAAGNNHFAKALSDPKVLVQTAWLALNGKQMINDITDYFQKEITQVRKESYNKGLADAKKKDVKPAVVYKNKGDKSQKSVYDDIDEF